MKQAKKLVSLLLTLVMVLAMSVNVFATNDNGGTTTVTGTTGTITVDNPQADQTYTAYKIFDVVYNEDKTAYSYTIDGTSEWFSVVATKVADGTVTSNITGLTFEKAYSGDTYVVITGNNFRAAEFANTLKSNTTGKKSGTALTVAGGKATVTGLELGYYFVTSTSGALCNLTTTNPDVTIHDKNDVPFEKTDDKDSVEVGETVTYTITGKVPDATGFTTYTYEISDTMTDGLTFNKDVKVKIGDTVINDATVTYDVANDANSFKVSIPVMNYQKQIGKPIEVTYTAVVNEKAVAKVEKNKATLTYSNDPTDSEKTTTTPPDEETVYSAKIIIDKYTTDDGTTKKLSGAVFALYKEVTENDLTLYYQYTAATETEGAKVKWVADINDATHVTTDDNGAAKFDGLKDGTYYLEETKAPAGYNLLSEPVEVTIDGAKATTENVSSLTVTKGVENNTGAELPATGGMGTTMFYVVGSILLIGAAVLLITKKRMSHNK